MKIDLPAVLFLLFVLAFAWRGCELVADETTSANAVWP